MSLQVLKQKRMLPCLHTGSDLLVRGGHLLRKATDPGHVQGGVNDERHLGAFIFHDFWL